MTALEYWESIKIFLLSIFGGFVSYIYIHLKEKELAKGTETEVKFDWEHMFILIAIGGFLGTIVDSSIPANLEQHKGLIIGAVSVFAYPILGLVEKSLPILFRRLTGLGKDEDTDKDKK